MSRPAVLRREIHGDLTCTSALHVGGWDPAALADLALARNGLGQPMIPGTALAGVLRGYLLNHPSRAFKDGINRLFGHITPNTEGGSPSLLRFDDAQLVAPEESLAWPILRTGVGIDRHSGTAAAKFLYAREVLPVGTTFGFRMVADTPTAAGALEDDHGLAALIRDAVDELTRALRSGWLSIGAGTSRGLGRVALSQVREREANLGTRAGLLSWLQGAPLTDLPATAAPHPAPGQLQVTITWRPISPVSSKDSLEGAVVSAIPLTEVRAGQEVHLLLPGSSIKGVLRAHCERIVRTLSPPKNPKESFEQMLAAPPSGVAALFGVAPQPGSGDTPQPTAGWRGALGVADCHSKRSVTADEWAQVVGLTPVKTSSPDKSQSARDDRNLARAKARSEFEEHLATLNHEFALKISDHVAIDRWTGGAADHRLFSVLDPAADTPWEPIQLTLDVGRLTRASKSGSGPPHPELALALLLLVLRDLSEGWLSLGFGGTRGRGQLEVDEIRFAGTGLPGPWQELVGRILDQDFLAAPPDVVTAAMKQWQAFFPEGTS